MKEKEIKEKRGRIHATRLSYFEALSSVVGSISSNVAMGVQTSQSQFKLIFQIIFFFKKTFKFNMNSCMIFENLYFNHQFIDSSIKKEFKEQRAKSKEQRAKSKEQREKSKEKRPKRKEKNGLK